ncbi:MAG: hypothetical protein ACRDTH_29040 [Pseudonocardiaceae bacterium]
MHLKQPAEPGPDVGSSHRVVAQLGQLDEATAQRLMNSSVVAVPERQFRDDLEVSQELDLHIWSRRPLGKRAREYAAELIRQSL